MYFSKKVSWILLTLYFIFDNVVSYWAITWMGGREANLVISHWVEIYPLLYFLCIPAELLGAYGTVWVLRRWIKEEIILTAAAIYWPIANSSINFIFVLGFHNMGYLWGPFTAVALVIVLIYGLLSLYIVGNKNKLDK